ncbi:MAG: TolB family protein [bacterium]
MKHRPLSLLLFFSLILISIATCSRQSYQTFLAQEPLIAFVSARDGDYSIYTMKEDGSSVTRLTNPSTDCVLRQCFDTYPAACGNNIAFSSNRTGRFEIYTITIDGKNLTQITNDPDADFIAPEYSNDCSILSYTKAMNIKRQLYILNLRSSSTLQLTNDNGSGACCGKISPDDKTMAYIHDPFPNANPIPSTEAPMSIYTISLDGSNRQWLCHTSNIIPPLSWSPDGKTILFLAVSPVTGHIQVFSMPVDCSEPPKALSDPDYDAFDPAFSPDGKYIAYVSTQYTNQRIFLMSPLGYKVFNIDITNDVHLNNQPAWQKGIILPVQ